MATAVCEKHKLRFDPDLHTGCVLCRRETGAEAAPPAGGDGMARSSAALSRAVEPAPVAPVSPAAPESTDLFGPLAIAGAIWLVSAFVLFGIHSRLAASLLYGETGANEAALGGLDDDTEPLQPGGGTAVGQSEAVLDEIAKLNEGDESEEAVDDPAAAADEGDAGAP